MRPFISAAQASKVSIPDTEQPQIVEAARNHMFAIRNTHFFNNTWFSDPMILGHYPADGLALFEADMPAMQGDDLATIHQPLDFFGANIYSGRYVHATPDGDIKKVADRQLPVTAMGWPITPEALYWAPRFFHERYGLPIVITENGMAHDDHLANDSIDDQPRIDFLQSYLQQYARAIADGVPAQGYFLWSVMDNFEWAEGYAKRFGLIHVDYASQQRTPKDSARWYRRVIASNGADLAG
jgi:beta-glucosidase